jgi:hypothetical protein
MATDNPFGVSSFQSGSSNGLESGNVHRKKGVTQDIVSKPKAGPNFLN